MDGHFQTLRAPPSVGSKRVVDIFASGLVPLKCMFSYEDDVFFALKCCTECYSAGQAPCGSCRRKMETVGRPPEKLVFTYMTPAEYVEAKITLNLHATKRKRDAA